MPVNSTPHLQERYESAIKEYRGIMADLDKAQKGHDLEYASRLDRLKNQLHRRLLEAGRRLGFDESRVFCDILAHGGDLSEYGLPEFALLQTAAALKNPQMKVLESNRGFSPQTDLLAKGGQESGYDMFIPFGAEIAWHFFQNEQFFTRSCDNLEKRRRAQALIKTDICPMLYMEIESMETFHRGIKLFGVAVSRKDAEKLVLHIAGFRERFSIKDEWLDAEQMTQDWIRIINEDMEYIRQYSLSEQNSAEKYRKNYYETCSMLLRNYLDAIERDNDVLKEHKEIAGQIIREQINIAESREMVDKMRRVPVNPFWLESPKQESFGKRIK